MINFDSSKAVRTPVAAAILATACAVGVSGCGGSSSSSKSTSGAKAAGASSKASSGSSGGAASSGDSGDMPQTLTAAEFSKRTGQAEKSAGTAHMETKMNMGTDMTEVADLKFADKSTQAHITIQGDSQMMKGMQEIIDGGTVYAQMPALGKGAQWYKMPSTSKALGNSAMSPFKNGVGGVTGPNSQEKLTKVSSSNGQTTYRLTLSAQQVQDEMKKEGVSSEAGKSPGAVTTETTVDSNWRPVKSTVKAGSGTVTTTFSKWGEPVSIQVPQNVKDFPSSSSGQA